MTWRVCSPHVIRDVCMRNLVNGGVSILHGCSAASVAKDMRHVKTATGPRR